MFQFFLIRQHLLVTNLRIFRTIFQCFSLSLLYTRFWSDLVHTHGFSCWLCSNTSKSVLPVSSLPYLLTRHPHLDVPCTPQTHPTLPSSSPSFKTSYLLLFLCSWSQKLGLFTIHLCSHSWNLIIMLIPLFFLQPMDHSDLQILSSNCLKTALWPLNLAHYSVNHGYKLGFVGTMAVVILWCLC